MAKDMGKKLRSLFWADDEDEQQVPAASAQAPIAAPAPSSGQGRKDDNVARTLQAAIDEANIGGYDYYEFAKTLDALTPTISAEQALFQTAFATGTVMGATKAKLLETANSYLTLLGTKEKEFEATAQQRFDQTVAKRETELPAIDAKIKEKSEQIRKMTEEIHALTASKTLVANEIAESKAKIEQVRNNFAATLQVFTAKITSDIEKIQKYLS